MGPDALELQSHRGARGLMPENTLAGAELAVKIGVHTLELDVGLTADGVVVLSHDPRLNPDITRDESGEWLRGPGPVIYHTRYAELRRYDVGAIRPGTRYAARFPDQQRMDGERMPTLESVIELTDRLSGSTLRYNIEIKRNPEKPELTADAETFARSVIVVLEETGVTDRTVLQSFDWSVVKQIHAIAPGMRTSCLTAQRSWLDTVQADRAGPSAWTAGIAIRDHNGSVPDMVHAAGADIWSPHHDDLDAAGLRRAHELDLRVIVWTVNRPQEMRALIDMGVDGIITDFPDRLRKAAGDAGYALPPALP